jgi:hypothetical protein
MWVNVPVAMRGQARPASAVERNREGAPTWVDPPGASPEGGHPADPLPRVAPKGVYILSANARVMDPPNGGNRRVTGRPYGRRTVTSSALTG